MAKKERKSRSPRKGVGASIRGWLGSARAARSRSRHSPESAGKRGWKVRLAAWAALAFAVYLLYPLPGILLMRWRDPRSTAFIDIYKAEAGPKARFRHEFVPLDRIAPALREAVLVAEDDAFFEHEGVDFEQLKKSVETNLKKGRYARGGSTITMQLAKNLYLSTQKSLLRKGRELIITFLLELCLSKERILEIYLNMIEWGRGIYGAEAAAQHYFGVSAAKLSPAQAATLAAAIPAPRLNDPAKPSERLARRRDMLLERMRRKGLKF